MSDIAIRVENIGKRYRIGALTQRRDTLRDQLVYMGQRMTATLRRKKILDQPLGEVWALQDVSFDVAHGQVLGVIAAFLQIFQLASGSPVMNLKGQVVGVVVGARESGQNLNFAIPGKYVLTLKDWPATPPKKAPAKGY